MPSKTYKQQRFNAWYNSIPYGEWKSTVQELRTRLSISKEMISYWRKGRIAIPDSALPIIEDIARKPIFKSV